MNMLNTPSPTDEAWEKRKSGEGSRTPPVEVVEKRTKTYRYFICQYEDCPNNKTLIKRKISQRGRMPSFHAGCQKTRKAEDQRKRAEKYAIDRANGVTDPDRPKTPADRRNTKGDICGAKRAQGAEGVCCLPAGWGTDHLGSGHCKLHTGATPNGYMHAAKEDAQRLMMKDMPTMGNPQDIGPHEAILQEVKRTSGHVEWLRMVIASIGIDPMSPAAEIAQEESGFLPEGAKKAMIQFTEAGMDAGAWVKIYQDERKHLVSVCKAAVAMGCAERTVALAEDQGRMVASVIRKVLGDPTLALTNAQQAAVPEIVRRELEVIDVASSEVQVQQVPATTPSR